MRRLSHGHAEISPTEVVFNNLLQEVIKPLALLSVNVVEQVGP